MRATQTSLQCKWSQEMAGTVGVLFAGMGVRSTSTMEIGLIPHSAAPRYIGVQEPATMPATIKVSILIPAYNEYPVLPLVLQRIFSAPLPKGCAKEVIVIDARSPACT